MKIYNIFKEIAHNQYDNMSHGDYYDWYEAMDENNLDIRDNEDVEYYLDFVYSKQLQDNFFENKELFYDYDLTFSLSDLERGQYIDRLERLFNK